jgi:hypothetical protein
MRILKKNCYTLLWNDFIRIIKAYGPEVLPRAAAFATTRNSENESLSTRSPFD